jgi:hypothetical protein
MGERQISLNREIAGDGRKREAGGNRTTGYFAFAGVSRVPGFASSPIFPESLDFSEM